MLIDIACEVWPKRDPQIESDRCQEGIKTAVLACVFVAFAQQQCSSDSYIIQGCVCVRPVDLMVLFLSKVRLFDESLVPSLDLFSFIFYIRF